MLSQDQARAERACSLGGCHLDELELRPFPHGDRTEDLAADNDLRRTSSGLTSSDADVAISPRAGWLDLEWWWRAADVAVYCSETEAFPAVAIEAMVHGLPLLGTRVGDLPDLVEPGVTGWLCEPSDLRSMTEALSTVALTPAATLRAMGAAAARAVRPYDRAQLVGSTAELMRHVALGTRPQSAVALTHRRRQAPDPPISVGAVPRR